MNHQHSTALCIGSPRVREVVSAKQLRSGLAGRMSIGSWSLSASIQAGCAQPVSMQIRMALIGVFVPQVGA